MAELFNKQKKVKVDDISRAKILKTLLDDKLTETSSEINREEICKTFENLLLPSEFENFKVVLENLPEEFFEKIFKRIKTEYKIIHKYLILQIEEEKHVKDNQIKIIKEEENKELLAQATEKLNNLKTFIEKVFNFLCFKAKRSSKKLGKLLQKQN